MSEEKNGEMERVDLILPPGAVEANGEGYKTLAAAKMAMGKRGLRQQDYDILPYSGGGFGVKLADGIKLPELTRAKPKPKPEVIDDDSDAPFSAGVEADDFEDEDLEPEVKPYVETYRRVRFHPKSSEHQMDNVELSVNGETLLIEREKEVVIPNRFVQCARHATYPLFRQLPNQARKLIGSMMLFPFDDLGEGSEAEYNRQRESGTKASRENAKNEGLI
jgi:hypothetical protein